MCWNHFIGWSFGSLIFVWSVLLKEKPIEKKPLKMRVWCKMFNMLDWFNFLHLLEIIAINKLHTLNAMTTSLNFHNYTSEMTSTSLSFNHLNTINKSSFITNTFNLYIKYPYIILSFCLFGFQFVMISFYQSENVFPNPNCDVITVLHTVPPPISFQICWLGLDLPPFHRGTLVCGWALGSR